MSDREGALATICTVGLYLYPYPFKPVCLPLSYSGNPGVNASGREGQVVGYHSNLDAPYIYCTWTPLYYIRGAQAHYISPPVRYTLHMYGVCHREGCADVQHLPPERTNPACSRTSDVSFALVM